MVSIETIKNNLIELLNKIYAKKEHEHGYLTNDGQIGNESGKVIMTCTNGKICKVDKLPLSSVTHQDISGKLDKAQGLSKANKNIATDANGNITTEEKNNHIHSTSQITNFPTIGSGLSTNDFNDNYVQKINTISDYRIILSNTSNFSNKPPSQLAILKGGQIYAQVKKYDNTAAESGVINFIVNGRSYERSLTEDNGGIVSLQINLESKEPGVVKTSNGLQLDLVDTYYLVVAVYRGTDGWAHAIDIKNLIVTD